MTDALHQRFPQPSEHELVLKVIPMPADCNANGDIFGGWVMAQVDLAGSVIPARYTQGRMATVAVNPAPASRPNTMNRRRQGVDSRLIKTSTPTWMPVRTP